MDAQTTDILNTWCGCVFSRTVPVTNFYKAECNSVNFDNYDLKVALQILGRKVYENTEKSSLYSQSLLIFIHKTPVVECHQITREIRDLLLPRPTPTGNTVYFYMSSSLIYILKTH